MDNNIKIKIVANLDEISLEASTIFALRAIEAVKNRNRFLVALSGGSTPRHLYKILADNNDRNPLPWKAIHVFWVDERCVPPDHVESNYHVAYELLLSKVNIPKQNIHRMKGELPIEQTIVLYTQVLQQYSQDGFQWPRFDLVFLGLGADGHVASIFPDMVTSNLMLHPVMAVSKSYLQRPSERITLTPQVINSARQIIFIVSGSNKAEPVASVLNNLSKFPKLPAQLIQPDHGEVIWLLDQEASQNICLDNEPNNGK